MWRRLLTTLSTGVVSAVIGAAGSVIAEPTPPAPPPARPLDWTPGPRTVQPAAPPLSWTVDLRAGDPVDVAFRDGALQPTAVHGLVTFPAHRLDGPVGRVVPTLDAVQPPGTTAEVDLRGRLLDGRWTEWRPGIPDSPTELPAPATEIQARLVLSRPAGTASIPSVRGLRLHAEVVPDMLVDAPSEPLTYEVFATRLGLVDGRTANGHRPEDYFVALPSRRALAAKDGAEYSVKVCAAPRTCVWAPVWDVGPWNTRDDYWSPEREAFHALPQGLPAAQAAFADGHNGGRDGKGRKVLNPAGIDLSDRAFRSALKLTGNVRVTVTYLWTGPLPLSRVDTAEDTVTVRTAPSAAAPAAGVAADETGVPVECIETPEWLRIGPDEYLPADDVRLDDDVAVGPC